MCNVTVLHEQSNDHVSFLILFVLNYILWVVNLMVQVSFYLNWIVRNSAEAENLMSSVERVHEYSQLKTEIMVHPEGNLVHKLHKETNLGL